MTRKKGPWGTVGMVTLPETSDTEAAKTGWGLKRLDTTIACTCQILDSTGYELGVCKRRCGQLGSGMGK